MRRGDATIFGSRQPRTLRGHCASNHLALATLFARTLHSHCERITSPYQFMELFILGAGMGIVGGLIPSPLHMIALSQVALGRWTRAICILIGAPLLVDGCLLLVTLLFYRLIPSGIAHYVAYVGGVALISFASYSLWQMRGKTPQEMMESRALTYASVSVALLAEVASPGTWVYWLTIAGPILPKAARRDTGTWCLFSWAGYGAFTARPC